MKVTLDTNVLVSGTFWTGDSFRILELIDKKQIKNVLSMGIIKEYNKVINSDEIIEKIENKNLIMLKLVEKVIMNSELVEPGIKIDVVKEDKDDNKILECAKEGNVDCIITQDEHLLRLKKYDNIVIINPHDFLSVVKKKLGYS